MSARRRPTATPLFAEDMEARLSRMARLEEERKAATPAEPKIMSDFVVEDGALGLALESLVADLKMSSVFVERGIDCPTRALFIGPSGCGKTMACRWIGEQLAKPVTVVRIDATVSSYMGGTASNLRREFASATERGSILVLDEIDAVCRVRQSADSSSESEESARTTSALLQQLDSLRPDQIVIATTNLPDKIDSALRRRMGVEITFGPPGKNARTEMVLRWLARANLSDAFALNLISEGDGLPGASFRTLVMSRARDAIRAEAAA